MKTYRHRADVLDRRSLSRSGNSSESEFAVAIRKARDHIVRELNGSRIVHPHLLHLAMNEAEALAWQTEFPHLVFPSLAEEKARAVVAWAERQNAARRSPYEIAFAA